MCKGIERWNVFADDADREHEIKENVAVITLNRPEARNAFSWEMTDLWNGLLERARDDQEVRVIVVTGKGDTFCSGGDIREMAEGRLRSWGMNFLSEGVYRIVRTLENLDKPVIAAVNGAAMGAGMDMALMCDMRVCSDKAVMAESYIHLGLVPGDGGAYFLPRLVGPSRALELLLTGDPIQPEEAFAEWRHHGFESHSLRHFYALQPLPRQYLSIHGRIRWTRKTSFSG